MLTKEQILEIDEICKAYNITNYIINEYGRIDVNGDVTLSSLTLGRLPLSFGVIDGDFSCDNNKLTTLEGCPSHIKGNFNCNHNNLESLKYTPLVVSGKYNVRYNRINTLRYIPVEVNEFILSENQLSNLSKELFMVCRDFKISGNEIILSEENFLILYEVYLKNEIEKNSAKNIYVVMDKELLTCFDKWVCIRKRTDIINDIIFD